MLTKKNYLLLIIVLLSSLTSYLIGARIHRECMTREFPEIKLLMEMKDHKCYQEVERARSECKHSFHLGKVECAQIEMNQWECL